MSLRTSTDTAKIIANTVQCKNLVSDCFHVRSVQNCVRNVQDVLSPSQPAATSPDTAPLQRCLLLPRAQLQPEPAAMKTLLCTATLLQTPKLMEGTFQFVQKLQFGGYIEEAYTHTHMIYDIYPARHRIETTSNSGFWFLLKFFKPRHIHTL